MKLQPRNVTMYLLVLITVALYLRSNMKKALNKITNNVIFMEVVSSSTDHNCEQEELAHEEMGSQ